MVIAAVALARVATAMGFAMRARHTASAPKAVGIDLGTYCSRIGLWQDGDVLIIPNDRGRLSTPSCVAFTPQAILAGEAAQEQAESNLENTIFAPQRLIGFKFENPWVQWYMRKWPSKVVRGADEKPLIRVHDRGKERLLRPEEILTMLISHLRKSAEKYLGVTVMEAVVTVPSRYGKQQREAILEACKGARLNVLDLVKAPTAAAIAYNLTNRSRDKRNVLVCDMGGSYFDFAILTADNGHLVERAIGTDFVDLDGCLLRFCIQDLKEKKHINIAGHQLAIQRIRRSCEIAKRKLSHLQQARVEVSNVVEGVDYIVALSRLHFDELCRGDVGPLLEPVAWCLEDTGLEKSDVHEVLLVGGSARIPVVRRALREFFYGKALREVLKPEHAAVLGAASYVAILAGGGCGALGVPAELRHIMLEQVTPWTTVPTDASLGEYDSEGRVTPGKVEETTDGEDLRENIPTIPRDGVVNIPKSTQLPKNAKLKFEAVHAHLLI